MTVNHPNTATEPAEKIMPSIFLFLNVPIRPNTARIVTSAKMIGKPIFNPPCSNKRHEQAANTKLTENLLKYVDSSFRIYFNGFLKVCRGNKAFSIRREVTGLLVSGRLTFLNQYVPMFPIVV